MTKYNDITIHPFASAVHDKRYLLSYNGECYEVGDSLVELLIELQEKSTEEEAVFSYVQKKEGKYTPEQVRQVINKFIVPLFSVPKKKYTFIYEKEIFAASVIDEFSDKFSFLFKSKYMISVFTMALVLNIYFFLSTNNLLSFGNKVNIYMLTGTLVFILGSSFFHELGHASACKYFGVKHGCIGFGLYLNFPVLYTDVTEVWKLPRRKRCIVNIAGVYFQCYGLICLLVGFLLTGSDILRYLILIMNLGFVMTLNPFFKFDGYWIASDILGVPNLRMRSRELLIYWYKRVRKQPIAKIPYLLQVHSIEKYGLVVYSIVVNFFMGFYFFYIIPKFLYRFILSFPDELNELILYLSNGMTPPFALLRNVGMQLLFLALIGYLLFNQVHSLLKKYVSR